MSNKRKKSESPFEAFSSESTRQRWEFCHRAIAYAKESNSAALDETDSRTADTEGTAPLLTVVR